MGRAAASVPNDAIRDVGARGFLTDFVASDAQ